MKKVLDTYSSKNDINIKQIVAYKDNILEIEEYRDGFTKDDTMNVISNKICNFIVGRYCHWPRSDKKCRWLCNGLLQGNLHSQKRRTNDI